MANYYHDIQQIEKRKIDILGNISSSKFRLEFWRGIFLTLLLEPYTQTKKAQFIKNHFLHIAASFRLNYGLLVDKIVEVLETLKQERANLKSQLPKFLAQINPTVAKENSSIVIESEPSIKLERLRSGGFLFGRSQREEGFTNTVAPFSDSEEIYIYNSGLVLLWPFLPRFFESLKLTQRGQFVDLESTERAILILQYLVEGVTEIPEHFLSLNKILCGLDLLEPIVAKLEMNESEKDECASLLSAIISNWSILKNTSSEGFQRAFLQREGILKVCNSSLLLWVEQKTYDILLDHLPWNIKVVKLPWMKEILFVEW